MYFFSDKSQPPAEQVKCSLCHKEIAPTEGTHTPTLNRPVHVACLGDAMIAEHLIFTQIFRNHDPKGNHGNFQ